jgi:hypothetical protein
LPSDDLTLGLRCRRGQYRADIRPIEDEELHVQGKKIKIFLAAAGLAVVVGACSSSSSASSKPSKSQSTSTTAPSANAAVDPNAPEVVAPGDIPDNQVFVPYATADYTVTVPEGWSQSVSGPVTTYSDHYNTIRLETSSVPVAPTVASVGSTQVPALQRTVPNFQLGKVSQVSRPAGAAVLVTYRAGSATDPVTGKRVAIDVEQYEFWRNGRQVTVVLSGARGSDNVDPWKIVTDSFRWVG